MTDETTTRRWQEAQQGRAAWSPDGKDWHELGTVISSGTFTYEPEDDDEGLMLTTTTPATQTFSLVIPPAVRESLIDHLGLRLAMKEAADFEAELIRVGEEFSLSSETLLATADRATELAQTRGTTRVEELRRLVDRGVRRLAAAVRHPELDDLPPEEWEAAINRLAGLSD